MIPYYMLLFLLYDNIYEVKVKKKKRRRRKNASLATTTKDDQ